jgi:hypothetical protein
VLNAGVTGYSFYHYLGVLEGHLELAPDAFVVAFYGGNDFLDVIRPWHYFHHTAPPPRSREYWSRLSSAKELSSALVGNAFNELLYFHDYPDEVAVALRAAGEICDEIVRECRERGIVPVFVHVPPQVHGTPEQEERFHRILRALELTDGDRALFDRLADDLLSRLRALDVRIVDLRKDFADDPSRWYWSDLHVDVEAHERIADLLLPVVDSACRVR